MEERGSSPSWLPVPRPDAGPPALPEPQGPPPPGWLPPGSPPPGPPPSGGQEPSSGPRPRFGWRRFARSPRGAAGLAVLAAALLLWPFSGLSWIPWLIGLGALVVLRVLRLDGPLRGWDLPLAGLAVVIGLMLSTGPWAWALAASIGVLLAGLAQLPWWRLAAVGAVLCLISGIGYGVSSMQAAEIERQVQAHAGDQLRAAMGVARPELVLPTMLTAVESEDEQSICRMLTPQAEAQLLGATATPGCAEAVSELRRRLGATPSVGRNELPLPVATPGGWTVDGCATPWAVAAGPDLARVVIEQTAPAVQRFVVAGFGAC